VTLDDPDSPSRACEGDIDRSVPVALFKISHYPMIQGILGVIRSLGRVGISPTVRATGDQCCQTLT